MAKKWYNFFVVTDEARDRAGAPESPPKATPAPAPKRVIDVAPAADVETTFTEPVTNPIALDEIYDSAKIGTPAHGYTILKVAEMLESGHIRALTADVKKKSILVALDAAGVNVNDIIQDAVQRDRALDTYERVLERHIEELRARMDVENRRIEEEINAKLAELRARIEENSREVSREQENLKAWSARKRQEEQRIAEAVGYFVSENPISTTNAPPLKEGGADHVR